MVGRIHFGRFSPEKEDNFDFEKSRGQEPEENAVYCVTCHLFPVTHLVNCKESEIAKKLLCGTKFFD
jgi:hypothetical protein